MFSFAKLGVRRLLRTGMTGPPSSLSTVCTPLSVNYYNQHLPISLYTVCASALESSSSLFPASTTVPYTHLVFSKRFLRGKMLSLLS